MWSASVLKKDFSCWICNCKKNFDLCKYIIKYMANMKRLGYLIGGIIFQLVLVE